MSPTLIFVRYVLPAAIVITAVMAVVMSESSYRALEGGAMMAGAGLSVYLLNALHRMGASGDADRDREEAARRYFDEHGEWPDHA